MEPSVLIRSGVYLNLIEPDLEHIKIEDIALSLSRICRFTGHTTDIYTVAQHSVLVSRVVPKEYAMLGLMHDAAEAYLGDMSSPLKALFPGFKLLEKNILHAISKALQIPFDPDNAHVRNADLRLLATERRDLMTEHELVWPILEGIEPVPHKIQALTHEQARIEFLQRFDELRLLGFLHSFNGLR